MCEDLSGKVQEYLGRVRAVREKGLQSPGDEVPEFHDEGLHEDELPGARGIYEKLDAAVRKEISISEVGGATIPDMVNHPPHYTAGGIECIDAIKAALTPEEFAGYCKGCLIKYVWRERRKGGLQSLEKGQWYLQRLIDNYPGGAE